MRTFLVSTVCALVLASCGGGGASSGAGDMDVPRDPGPATRAHTPDPAWTPLVTLRQLGRFATRCNAGGGAPRFATMYVADPRFADETIALWRGRGDVERRTLDPGERWVLPLGPARMQRWRISQGTEPQTITAAVRITPSRCPYGIPNTVVRFGTSHFNSGS
jgi:hypothetical protein